MSTNSMADRYVSLLKKSLLDELYLENEARIGYLIDHFIGKSFPPLDLMVREFVSIRHQPIFDAVKQSRKQGEWVARWISDSQGRKHEIFPARNFAFTSHTMIGRARIENLHSCMDQIIKDDVPGDFIETGVWKGGATIIMRGFLAAHNITSRVVWVADSFQGLPVSVHALDTSIDLSATAFPYLSVSLDEVKELFSRYELLDDQVRFLQGWFCDSLPEAPIKQLSLLRLDGDLYSSTMDALVALYDKVSAGGFIIVDDYNALPQCKQAIEDFRRSRLITDPIQPIDDWSAYWRKG